MHSQMKVFVSIAAAQPSGSNVPTLIHICRAVNICVSSPHRAGAPGNQKASVVTAKMDRTPREVWLPSLKCLQHLLFTTSWSCPCASQSLEEQGTSLVRPSRVALRVQEQFPTNPSSLSNLPGTLLSSLQAGCHTSQPNSL